MYAKFLKDMISKKIKLTDKEEVALTEESSVRLQNKLPPKLKDPRNFILHILLGKRFDFITLCDTCACVN